MRSGLITEATVVGGSLFVVGAALMQFRQEGITDKRYWPYLGVFITGFSAHLIFEAFGLNKKYCDVAFNADPDDWGEEIDWDNDESKKDDDLFGEIEWDAESKDEARMKKYEKTYGTEGAKVRNRIFKRILAKAQDGTKAGQWSARKAQSLTEDYEKAMKRKGKKAYKGGKKTKSQKSLKKWGDQKWTTKSGKKSSKTGERYLPKKAIKALSDKEYKETSDKKREDTKKGKQFSKQPKKVADKVKKYRADGYGSGGYYGYGSILKRPSKRARAKMGWTKQDDARMQSTWKSKQQEPKEITEFEKEMIWVENMFNQNRYYCKRYEDIPYLQRKTFSGKNLRRGNRCYNCRSKECPSKLLSWKQAHRLADEADDRRAKTYGVREELIESGEYPEYLRRDRDSILKDLFGAEGEIPYGVHVESHKTTSTVFYKRKPFRKYRGNRHREQAQAYASFMESKLKRNPRYFNYYAESFEAEDEPQAYLMCDWNKKVPYEIHNAGCKHRNFYEKRWESDIDLWNPTSLERVCRDYIQMWEENLEGAGDWFEEGYLDAIAKMTFSQFMRSKYTKTTTPIKLSPCHKQNPKIKEFMDNTLVGDISPLTYLRHDAEEFEAEGKPTSVEVKRSTNDEKKLMAVFTYPDERTKTTHFGQRGASDYTKHGEKERMERYLERHGGGTTTSTKEDWNDPTTAGALSRWILWNKPSLSASFNDFKRRFNLKGDLKVSKSAESFDAELKPTIRKEKEESVREFADKLTKHRLAQRGIIESMYHPAMTAKERAELFQKEVESYSGVSLGSQWLYSMKRDDGSRGYVLMRLKSGNFGDYLYIATLVRPQEMYEGDNDLPRYLKHGFEGKGFAGEFLRWLVAMADYRQVPILLDVEPFIPNVLGPFSNKGFYVRENLEGKPCKNCDEEDWLDDLDEDVIEWAKKVGAYGKWGGKLRLVEVKGTEQKYECDVCKDYRWANWSPTKTREALIDYYSQFGFQSARRIRGEIMEYVPIADLDYSRSRMIYTPKKQSPEKLWRRLLRMKKPQMEMPPHIMSYDAETFQAPYTLSQELSDYTPEEIVESSAIEGFQPSKFSVMGNRAETFEADSCRECGRKEGPYSDTVLIACKGCPELSCQHCLDEENNGCAFCIKKRAESEYSWFDDLKESLEMMQDANNIELIDYELNQQVRHEGSAIYEMGYGESLEKIISDLRYYYSQERGQIKPFSQLIRGQVNYYPQGQYEGVGAINFNMKRINEYGAVVEVIFPNWDEKCNALFFRNTPLFDAEGEHNGLNLVMMGVPGSGKGTQSKLITNEYGWPQIGMGDLIRDNMRRKTPLGVKCEPYMAKGSLVPDEIMIELVSQRLKEDDCKNGFILDGFPRTVPQGKALEKITNIDAVFFLDTKKQVVIERLGGRRTCSDCGEIYHQLFQPPQQEGTCDLCKGELFIRPDDNPKTISNRLSVFKTKTQPLIDFYEQRNLLRPIQSNSTPQDVFESIDSDIQSMLLSGDMMALEAQDTPYCDYHTQLVLGAENGFIMGAEHYTGSRPMTCPICINTLSEY